MYQSLLMTMSLLIINIKLMMRTRRRNLNKNLNGFDEFLMRVKAPGAPEITVNELSDGTKWNSKQVDLFANIESSKKVIGYLQNNGFDPFKAGTKEPERILEFLKDVSWEQVEGCEAPSSVRSAFDGPVAPQRKKLLDVEKLATIAMNKEEKFVMKLFNPAGAGTWYIKSLDEVRLKKGDEYKAVYSYEDTVAHLKEGWDADDIIVFGYARITDWEYGSVSIKELEEFSGPMGLGIEVDKYFTPTPCDELINQLA